MSTWSFIIMKLGLLILAQPGIIIECRFWLKMAHLFFIPPLLPWLGWAGSGCALERTLGQPAKLWGDGGLA